jgi:hypothetical protein
VARLLGPAALALALLAPVTYSRADDTTDSGRLGYQWVDGKGGVPEKDIKHTVGVTVGAVIGGLVILGWLLKSRD